MFKKTETDCKEVEVIMLRPVSVVVKSVLDNMFGLTRGTKVYTGVRGVVLSHIVLYSEGTGNRRVVCV